MNFNQLIENFRPTAKLIGKWVIEVTLYIMAFLIGYHYIAIKQAIKPTPKEQTTIKPITLEDCSVSVTDRGEMLIINRNNGQIEVYNDSVGLAVFKLYGLRLSTSQDK